MSAMDNLVGLTIALVMVILALVVTLVPWSRLRRGRGPNTVPSTEEEPLTCSYCGGTSFYEGPSGGASTNVLCAEPTCRHWFNICPAVGYVEDLHRVEPAEVRS